MREDYDHDMFNDENIVHELFNGILHNLRLRGTHVFFYELRRYFKRGPYEL